jgi:hypothetical protein
VATGFIYVVKTVTRHYEQKSFHCTPTEWERRIYFGPCKRAMRPKMRAGDYVFGISPSHKGTPRRIVFIARIEERITFAEAYERFPELRGPDGPIHVRPVTRAGLPFPRSHYEHIPEATHCEDWDHDLTSADQDAFFVCSEPEGCCGHWLGASGPEIDTDILEFLTACSVHGSAGPLAVRNEHATRATPIAHRGPKGGLLTVGLHLETQKPEGLLELCAARWPDEERYVDYRPVRRRRAPTDRSERGCR